MTESHTPRRGRFSLKAKLALLALFAVCVIGAAAIFNRSGKKPSTATPAVPVVTARAALADMPIWLSAIGTVTPINVVDVKPRVDGQLQATTVSEGEMVAAGQTIARIDPRPFAAIVAQARATAARDQAQLANARLESARTSALAAAGAGTAQVADAARAQEQALRATVAADDAAVDAATLNLGFTSIRAPFAGRVGLRTVNPGTLVHSTDTLGIMTVTQMTPISILFALPQDDLDRILAGQRKAALPVAAHARTGSTRLADGRLVFVGSTVDPTTGQFQLRATFANADLALWPGEFVSIRLLTAVHRGVVVVPDRAAMTSETGRYVYVLGRDGKVRVRNIRVGATFEGRIEVESGLKSGETVVVSGQSRLSPGAPVVVRQVGGSRP